MNCVNVFGVMFVGGADGAELAGQLSKKRDALNRKTKVCLTYPVVLHTADKRGAVVIVNGPPLGINSFTVVVRYVHFYIFHE